MLTSLNEIAPDNDTADDNKEYALDDIESTYKESEKSPNQAKPR